MSDVECMVLGLLTQGFRYGHELDKIIKERQLRIWFKMTRASLYRALGRINKKGWAESEIEKEGQYPERRVYKITKEGRQALADMVANGLGSSEFTELKICIYITFLDTLPKDIAIKQLEKRKASKITLFEALKTSYDNCENIFKKRMNILFLKNYCEIEINWIDNLINGLREKL